VGLSHVVVVGTAPWAATGAWDVRSGDAGRRQAPHDLRCEARGGAAGRAGAGRRRSDSDVFGSLVKQWKLKQKAARADWLIGKAQLTSKVKGVAIRSMKAPGTAYDDPVLGKDPQPGHMRHYQDVDYDNGGVHINSGIPNHAFYLAAMEIGGYAWDKAGRIWYLTLRDRLRRAATFHKAAEITFRVAGELYGKGNQEARFFELPSTLSHAQPGADRFQYTVTVETRERRHTVEIAEGAAPPRLRPLLDWLTAKARQKP